LLSPNAAVRRTIDISETSKSTTLQGEEDFVANSGLSGCDRARGDIQGRSRNHLEHIHRPLRKARQLAPEKERLNPSLKTPECHGLHHGVTTN
jgi:hypothetical protein